MSALKTYLEQIAKSKGMEHMVALRAMRTYIKLTPDEELATEIQRIRDVKLLRILVEAGLKPLLMKVTLMRYEELTGKGGGT